MRGRSEALVTKLDAGVAFDELSTVGKLLTDSAYARVALNLLPNGTGGLKTRPGSHSLVTSLTQQFLAPFDLSGTSFLIAATYTTIGSINLSSPAAPTNMKGAYTFTSGMPAWVQSTPTGSQGPFFAMNGVDTPFHWGGSGDISAWTASAGSVPNGRMLAQVGNRIWAAGKPSTPSRLYYTSLNAVGGVDARNWDSNAPNDGGFIDLSPDDGQIIQAIVAWQNYLVVLKDRKVFLFYDTAGGAANRQVSEAAGALGFGSVWNTSSNTNGCACATPYGVVFAAAETTVSGTGQFRLYITDGTSVRPLGKVPLAIFSQSGSKQPSLTFYGNRLYLLGAQPIFAGSTGRTSGPIIVYDFDTAAWWTLGLNDQSSGIEGTYTPAVARDPSTNTHRLYGVGSTSQRLWRLFDDTANAQDNAQSFVWYYLPSWATLGSRTRRKQIEAVVVECNGTYTLESMRDGDYSTLTSEAGVNQNSPDFQQRHNTPGPARLLGLRFAGQSSSHAQLFSYAVESTLRAD